MTAWSSLPHSVLMWCLRSSRSVMRVLYTSFAVYSTRCSPPDLNLVNYFGGHSSGEMNWRFSFFSWKRHFDDVELNVIITYTVVQVMMALLFFQLHEMSRWIVPAITKMSWSLLKLCLKYYWFLFSGHGVYVRHVIFSVLRNQQKKQKEYTTLQRL